MMFKSSSEKYLTNHKYQLASIFCISPTTIIVTLGKENEEKYDQLNHIYTYDSYVFCQGNQLKPFSSCRFLDIIKEENEELPKMIAMNKNFKEFQPIGFKKIVNEIMSQPFEVKILNQNHVIAIDSYWKKIQLIDIGEQYADLQSSQKQFKSGSQAVKAIYDITCRDNFSIITTLNLLDSYTALFHISEFPSRNSILNCMDIQYQSIEWQQLNRGYNGMLNKIVKVRQKTFLNGIIDSEWATSLRLYDIRVKGNVLNVLHLDDQIFPRLRPRWAIAGQINANFNNICKSKRQFEIVGMTSFRAQTYNFPYILDLRKPNHILPFNLPNGRYLSHIKCFEVVDNTIVAIERQYSNFILKKTELCLYQFQ